MNRPTPSPLPGGELANGASNEAPLPGGEPATYGRKVAPLLGGEGVGSWSQCTIKKSWRLSSTAPAGSSGTHHPIHLTPLTLLTYLTLSLWLIPCLQTRGQVIGRPPVITNQPISRIVVAGSDVTLGVGVAPSSTPLSFRWRRGPFDIAGATNSTLFLTKIQVASGGGYAATVANAAGSVVSDTATLTVAEVNSQSVSVGANVTFKLDTRGSAVSGLQWQFNGAAIAGATNSSLVVANAQPTNAGTYALFLTNSVASLTVPVKLEVDATFTKITTGGVAAAISSPSGAWGDYDNDGFLDLFTTSLGMGSTTNFLYRNKGDGTFTTIIADIFPGTAGDSTAGVWADYDNDGHLDLFVSRGAQSGRNTNILYRNQGDGALLIAAAGDPVTEMGGFIGAAWADYDSDGFVDLFVANGSSVQSRDFLYRNKGDGTFVRTTSNAIVDEATANYTGAWSDYDNDGDPDLFVPNAGTEGNAFLFQNNGDGTFRKISSGPGLTGIVSALSAAWGDYDNDGFQDLFLGNNGLFRNNSDGTFTKVTSGGIVEDPGGFSRVGVWGDYDNDGFLDLFVSASLGGNRLFHNNGDGSFTRIASGSLANDPPGGFGDCAWADYNNDGFLDLFVANGSTAARDFTPNYLYRNNGNTHSWIQIKCVGAASNRSAIGAKVRVKAVPNPNRNPNPTWQLREISSGFGGQNNLRAHFGLGNATNIDTVRIEWPSGIVQEMRNVAAKQFLTVTEPTVVIGPKTVEFVGGADIVFNVLTNSTLLTNYQWRLNGVDLPGETKATLSVSGVGASGAGKYTVAITLPNGDTVESSAGVIKPPVPPTITAQPVSLTVNPGESATFQVAASGSPPLSYQWTLNGTGINGATNATLVLPNAQPENVGDYTVEVRNAARSVTSTNATLTLIGAAKIGTQPKDQSVSLGANVIFSVTASGTSPFTYQWRLNGTDIAGATNRTLTVTNVVLSDSGKRFSVFVRNTLGSTTSREATLEVDPTFTKVTDSPITKDAAEGGGASWGDYNKDGWLDLIVSRNNSTNLLYRNNGDGTFIKVPAASAGPILTRSGTFLSPVWADFDNDGYLDLFNVNNGTSSGPNRLYKNLGDGTFKELNRAEAGVIVTEGGSSFTASWADYDLDGYLDLVVNNSGIRNYLYHNNGDGSFIKITNSVVAVSVGGSSGGNLRNAFAWGDFDNDGDDDLFVTGYDRPNVLFINNGDGTFTKSSLELLSPRSLKSVMATWADFDNDGNLDLFVARSNEGNTPNLLFRNLGDGTFTQDTNSVVAREPSRGVQSFIGAWGDYDNDGYLDLFVANTGNDFLYHNNGDGTFTKVITGSPVNDNSDSFHACWGDYDNDGFLDLFVLSGNGLPNNRLYRNNGNVNSWIKFKLEGRLSNRSAIGAKVRVHATIRGRTMWQLREVISGSGFGSPNQLEPHFGLGNATIIDTVRIEWPSGIVQEMRNVAAKQFLTVTEPSVAIAQVLPSGQTNRVMVTEVAAGADFTLHAPTVPTLPRFQWLQEGKELAGQTNATLSAKNVGAAERGLYSVVLSNPVTGETVRAAPIRLNVRVVKFIADAVTVSTFAGGGSIPFPDGPGPNGEFNLPNGGFVAGVFVPGEDLIAIADTLNHRIRLLKTTGEFVIGPTGRIGTGEPGYADGPAATAKFNTPLGVIQHKATEATQGIYVADTGNNRIRKITFDGIVTTFAGSGVKGYRDGPALGAQFDYPNDLTVDREGNLYVSEFQNHTIRKISPDGTVSTVAGQGGNRGYADGRGSEALFNQPGCIAIDGQGNLYVTEWGGHRIRRIGVEGNVTTVAGNGVAGYVDGVGTNAQFNTPDGIVVDLAGHLYVAEFGNDVIRRITPAGVVETVAGTGVQGSTDGPGSTAQFYNPVGIGVDVRGILYVADTANHRVRKIVIEASTTVPGQPRLAARFDTVNNAIQLTVTGPAGQSFAIEASTDLVTWTRLVTVTSQAGSASYTDQAGANFRQRFYRAVKQ